MEPSEEMPQKRNLPQKHATPAKPFHSSANAPAPAAKPHPSGKPPTPAANLHSSGKPPLQRQTPTPAANSPKLSILTSTYKYL